MSRPTTFICVSVLLAARSLAATYPISLASRSSVVSCSSSAPGRYHYSLSVPTAADCLAACGGLASDATAVLRREGRGEYDCFCLQENDLDALDDSQCAPDSWYAYTALPEATKSEPAEDGVEAPKYATPDKAGGRGGRLVIQNKRGRERHIGLCEAGYKPCKVLGHDATYKCVDTQTSLTACGACVAGEYVIGGVNATTLGYDCTALLGVASGNVQCKAGRCVIGSCVEGFRLSGSRCVRT